MDKLFNDQKCSSLKELKTFFLEVKFQVFNVSVLFLMFQSDWKVILVNLVEWTVELFKLKSRLKTVLKTEDIFLSKQLWKLSFSFSHFNKYTVRIWKLGLMLNIVMFLL